MTVIKITEMTIYSKPQLLQKYDIPFICIIFQYTLGNILERVQASEVEIRQAIEELPVVEIDGETFSACAHSESEYVVKNIFLRDFFPVSFLILHKDTLSRELWDKMYNKDDHTTGW